MTALTKITTEYVSTKEGRVGYLAFLETHPNISPIQKLFGLHAPSQIEPFEVKNHVRALIINIYPDKLPEDEKQVGTMIFRLINEARKRVIPDAIEPLELEDFVPSGSFRNPFVDKNNPLQFLYALVRGKKWYRAKKIVESNEISNPEFRILSAITHLHINDLSAAINHLPDHLVETKKIIRECQEAITSKSLTQLNNALIQARRLEEVYREESEDNDVEPLLFRDAIPYKLFVELKEIYKESDHLSYECQLRNAIRFCPTGTDEKQALINELFRLRRPKLDYSSAPVQEKIADRQRHIWTQPSELAFSRTHQILASEAINTQNIDQLVSAINEILEEEKRWFCRLIGMIIYVISLSYFGDWHSNFYYDQIRKPLKEWLARAKGFDLFSKRTIAEAAGERRSADYLTEQCADQFQTARDFASYGLVEQVRRHYKSAISSWRRCFEGTEQPSEVEEDKIYSYAEEVMNLNDALQVDENTTTQIQFLGEVDEFQRKVLQKQSTIE